ncbi:hypothetical protein [Nocardioides sp. MH1]|uniref:hypothetical protein n=1 Tax=Nocardioides sp. MH1 TaxID=3242490 RepID=UPI003520B016
MTETSRVLADVESKLGRPFPLAADLVSARERLDQVNAELAGQAQPVTAPVQPASAEAP